MSTSSVALWTESAPPLPFPSLAELDNPIYLKTLRENPTLFKIVTPINVDMFEFLLTNHPNCPFVESVCRGLREGFWPWADTLRDGYPISHDESYGPPSNPDHAAFLREQRQKEMDKGRFSAPFGSNLLPGMYAMPIHAVPKPGSSDFQMVTNQSAGDFSLNSMVNRGDVFGAPLDGMRRLG
ncbi:hypothetical protein BDN72DRAFT_777343, partial [Pluteus cervinus]